MEKKQFLSERIGRLIFAFIIIILLKLEVNNSILYIGKFILLSIILVIYRNLEIKYRREKQNKTRYLEKDYKKKDLLFYLGLGILFGIDIYFFRREFYIYIIVIFIILIIKTFFDYYREFGGKDEKG